MSQRVQIMGSIGLAVAHDALDHLTAGGGIARDREIEAAKVKLADLAHICEFENLEGEHEIARSPVLADADAEDSINEAQPPELRLLDSHLVSKGIEKLDRGKL